MPTRTPLTPSLSFSRAVAQSLGGIGNIPEDMELSDEVLARLTASQGLMADELYIDIDPETGAAILRLRRPSMVGGQLCQIVSRPKYGELRSEQLL